MIATLPKTDLSFAKILIAEDDTALRRLLTDELTDAGMQVRSTADGESAWSMIEDWRPDLVLSDLRLCGTDGLQLLARTRRMENPPGFILMTAFGTISQAVAALQEGADDFLTKPLELDHLIHRVRRTIENREMRQELNRFRKTVSDGSFHAMIGHSDKMTSLFTAIKQVGRAMGPVLVSGESGTGKDLVARAVHGESSRSNGPFIAVNCAAIPAELQESEFFGHASGSFTGAESARKGLFAEADGGTLFLDEVGDMPGTLQAKLLRILQDGHMRPIGENRETRLDVRVIAATNRNLEEAVQEGAFREDLFFRLETFSLTVPPLRDRGEDLDLLTAHFIQQLSSRMGRPVRGVSNSALKLLHSYPFPGNVRELRNALERAVAFCSGPEIVPECLPERIRNHNPASDPVSSLLAKLTRDNIYPTMNELCNSYAAYVVDRLHGNKRQAAKILDISRATLYRRLGIHKQ